MSTIKVTYQIDTVVTILDEAGLNLLAEYETVKKLIAEGKEVSPPWAAAHEKLSSDATVGEVLTTLVSEITAFLVKSYLKFTYENDIDGLVLRIPKIQYNETLPPIPLPEDAVPQIVYVARPEPTTKGNA